MAQAVQVGQAVAAVMVQVDQVGQAVAVMVQVDQAARVYQAVAIPRVSPVPAILRMPQIAVNRRVSRRAVIRAAIQPLPLVQQWEDTQSPMVLFIQAPFTAGLNRFPIIVISAVAGGTVTGKRAKRRWTGRATKGAGSLVSSGIDSGVGSNFL
jgi:hypothetical protein